MKMSKAHKRSEDKTGPLLEQISGLKKENETLKKSMEEAKKLITNLESRIDKHIASYNHDKKSWSEEDPGK